MTENPIVRAVEASPRDVYDGKAFYGQEPGGDSLTVKLYRYPTPAEETAGLTVAVEKRDDLDNPWWGD